MQTITSVNLNRMYQPVQPWVLDTLVPYQQKIKKVLLEFANNGMYCNFQQVITVLQYIFQYFHFLIICTFTGGRCCTLNHLKTSFQLVCRLNTKGLKLGFGTSLPVLLEVRQWAGVGFFNAPHSSGPNQFGTPLASQQATFHCQFTYTHKRN